MAEVDVKTSAAGRAFVSREEGRIPHAYLDSHGYPTVGVGHLIRRGEHFGPVLPVRDPTRTVSDEQIDALLEADLAASEAAVNALGVELSQNAFDALIDFVFNLGPGILGKGHTLGDCLRAGDERGVVADAFRLYDHAGGREDKALLARRMAERELFLRPDAPAPAAGSAEDEAPATDPAGCA